MENEPFIGDLPIQILIFHSYVSLTEGTKWVYMKNVENPAFMDQIWSYKYNI